MLDRDRENLMSGDLDQIRARPEILESWHRCRMIGVSPDRMELRYQPVTLDGRLARCAIPVLDATTETMIGAKTSLLLTDRQGTLIWRWSENTELGNELDRKDVVIGTHWDETAVGTGGVGTALELVQALTVRGAEHYVEALHPLACVAAPIRHPITRRVEGVLNITCLVADEHPLMKPTILRLVREIEAELYGQSSLQDRQLFQHFLSERRRLRAAVVAMNDNVVIANRLGAQLELDPRSWTADDDDVDRDLVLKTDRAGRTIEVRQVRDEGSAIGMLMVVEEPRGRAHRDANVGSASRPKAVPARPETASGTATLRLRSWDGVVDDALRLLALGEPILVTGEPGVGKRTLLAEIATGELDIIDCADIEAGRELGSGDHQVALTHLEALDEAAATRMAQVVLADRESGTALVLGASLNVGPTKLTPAQQRLVGMFNFERVEVPPLRERGDEIGVMVKAILAAIPDHEVHFTAAALDALRDYRWPGNISELESLIRWAVSQGSPVIDVRDLPPHVRSDRSRRLTPLEAAEADLIVQALKQSNGNKVMAAATLGIARSSLYRKMRAYRLT